ncbi:hypothetical protein MKY34_19870 [Sporosarcina sp. FSL K6-1522]
MRVEEKQLREDLAIFIEKMKKAGIDVTKIKKPTDIGVSRQMISR